MILHIPHASIDTLGRKFLCDLDAELERMTDIDTDKLYDYPHAEKVIFPVSRLICDVERFENDSEEEMAKYGMGVCYTKNALGEPLRVVTPEERAWIIENLYRPHHRRLTETVDRELKQKGKALLIDCHSFPNDPLPCNISQKTPRPQICIGTDTFHTPDSLRDLSVDYFENLGYTVCVNEPFSGTLIPMKHYRKDKRVSGIMLELNKNIYLEDFEGVKEVVFGWLELIDSLHNELSE